MFIEHICYFSPGTQCYQWKPKFLYKYRVYLNVYGCGCHRDCATMMLLFSTSYANDTKTGGYKSAYMLPPSNQWTRFTYTYRRIHCIHNANSWDWFNNIREAKTDSTVLCPVWSVGIIECVYSSNVIVLSRVNSKFVSFRSLVFCSFVFDFWLSVDGIYVCKSILYKIRWNKTLVKIKICNKLLKHLQKYEILKIRYNKH